MFGRTLLTGYDPFENKKLLVWAKGHVMFGRDPRVYRTDDLGNVIRFSDYGNRSSTYGWEFDHFPIPAALGGTDDVLNLRPLHWRINARLGGALSGLRAVR